MDRSRERDHNVELPKLYSTFLGEVAAVQDYGVFVKIPGQRKQGLVHKSQMSRVRVDDPSELCSVGESVYCKVISIQEDTQKIGLSMKVINQTTGKDLDPNQVQTAMDDQKRKTGFVREKPKIELGAVFDTTCRKCGGEGHLAQDCFHVPGGEAYELLPDLSEMVADEDVQRKIKKKAKKEKKKHKKEKKKKKAKKMAQRKSSSDSDSSEEEIETKILKKSRNIRKRQLSDSDSDSSDSADDHKRPKRPSSTHQGEGHPRRTPQDHHHSNRQSSPSPKRQPREQERERRISEGSHNRQQRRHSDNYSKEPDRRHRSPDRNTEHPRRYSGEYKKQFSRDYHRQQSREYQRASHRERTPERGHYSPDRTRRLSGGHGNRSPDHRPSNSRRRSSHSFSNDDTESRSNDRYKHR